MRRAREAAEAAAAKEKEEMYMSRAELIKVQEENARKREEAAKAVCQFLFSWVVFHSYFLCVVENVGQSGGVGATENRVGFVCGGTTVVCKAQQNLARTQPTAAGVSNSPRACGQGRKQGAGGLRYFVCLFLIYFLQTRAGRSGFAGIAAIRAGAGYLCSAGSRGVG
jgi:hypothetical protein